MEEDNSASKSTEPPSGTRSHPATASASDAARNIPTWDDYFMGMAKLASLRSKDTNTKVFLQCISTTLLIKLFCELHMHDSSCC